MLNLHDGRSGERGQTLVFFAIFLIVLLGATAVAVDYGSWLKSRRDYQNVVDAAVLQGSAHLVRPITADKQIDAREAAWRSIETQLGLTLDEAALAAAGNTSQGTPVQEDGWRMWVSTPPLAASGPDGYTGDYVNSDRVMFAWIERDNSAYFQQVFGLGDVRVSAWATSGTFPNRFAIITLRKNGDPTMGNPQDIDIAGGTVVTVIDGDVGGNWGMAISGVNSRLQFDATTGDAYGAYLTENVSGTSAGNNWTPGQVTTVGGTPIPVGFHREVADPNYPAPCGGLMTFSADPLASACLEDRAANPLYTASYRSSTTRAGDTCPYDPATNVDHLPAGRYDTIRIDNGECVVLDPIFDPKTGRQNGIFFVDKLDMDNNSLLIADGVTLVFRRTGAANDGLVMRAGAAISLNNGDLADNPLAAACSPDCKYGAWSAKSNGGGTYMWTAGLAPTYQAPPSDPFERGMAAYVCKSAADCDSGGSPSTNIFNVTSGSGIDWLGLVYAPFDNVVLSGQPGHQNVGQLVSWTLQFTGGVEIQETFDGPDSGTPVLLEPRLGQ